MSQSAPIRIDLQLIADMVEPGGRALDVGCGDGSLLAYLVNFKRVDARGMELSQAGVNACVANGLSVIQGDADTDLRDYPDDAFDYVILSQTLQATREPRAVLKQMLRVGKRAIVQALNAAAANVSFVEVDTDKGHDAFLLDEPEMFRTLQGFLQGAATARGLSGGHA